MNKSVLKTAVNSFIAFPTLTAVKTAKFIKAKLLLIVLTLLTVPAAQAQITPATPRYNESVVNVIGAQAHVDGTVNFKALKFSLDAAGTKWRTALLQNKIPGVSPEINVVAYYKNMANPPHALIMDANSDNIFGDGATDDLYAPYQAQNTSFNIGREHYSKTAVAAFFGAQQVMKYLDAHSAWGWHGFDQAGNIPISILICNEANFLYDARAYYNPSGPAIHVRALPFSDKCESGIALTTIAHEFFHGIWGHVPDPNPDTGIYAEALNEGLSDIFEKMVYNYYRVSQGQAFTWLEYPGQFLPICESEKSSIEDFYYAGETGFGKTLPVHGGFTYTTELQKAIPDSHVIGYIMRHWFYLISEGGKGINEYGIPYDIIGIGPEKAMDLIFDVVSNWGANPANTDAIHRFAIASLQSSVTNYGAGSPEHLSVLAAWEALNMFGEATIPQEVEYTAQSLYNNEVIIKVREYTVLGKKTYSMISGISPSVLIKYTPILNKEGLQVSDLDEDHIFFEDNDQLRSKRAVSMYWGILYTLNHLDQKGIHLKDIHPENLKVADNLTDDVKFQLENLAASVSHILNSHLTGNPDPVSHNERCSVLDATYDILGLMVKNQWRSEQPADPLYPDKNKPTYLYGEDVTPGGTRNFADPKVLVQPDFYGGDHYEVYPSNVTESQKNSTIMSHWYYLLAEGGAGYRDDDVSLGSYYLPGIGRKLADEIMIEFYKLELSNASFESFADARALILQIADNLSSGDAVLQNELKANIEEAWYAVGIGTGAQPGNYWPNDQFADNPATNAMMWPTPIGQVAKFKTEVAWEFQLSEDKNFLDPETTRIFPADALNVNDFSDQHTARIHLNLDEKTTYYWRSRATLFVTADGQVVSAKDIYGGEAPQQDLLWSLTHEFTTQEVKPKLIGEYNDSFYPWNGEFTWEVAGKTEVPSYHIQLSKDPQFTAVESYLDVDFTVKTSGQQTWGAPLEKMQDYYFEAQAIGPEHSMYPKRLALGSASEPQFVRTKVPDAACKLPKDGSEQLAWSELILEAKPTEGASGYDFEVADNVQFNQSKIIPTSQLDIDPLTSADISGMLPELGKVEGGKKYYWRVIPVGPILPLDAKDKIERGNPKDVFHFTIQKPGLISPEKESYQTSTMIPEVGKLHFEWEPYPEAAGYKIYIYKDGTQIYGASLSNTEIALPASIFYNGLSNDPKEPEAVFSWKVGAVPPSSDPNLVEIESEEWTFKMEGDQPVLLSPGVAYYEPGITT
ncbi:MAG: M4 family metallopeptidase, partial [Daejeonella sp.]